MSKDENTGNNKHYYRLLERVGKNLLCFTNVDSVYPIGLGINIIEESCRENINEWYRNTEFSDSTLFVQYQRPFFKFCIGNYLGLKVCLLFNNKQTQFNKYEESKKKFKIKAFKIEKSISIWIYSQRA